MKVRIDNEIANLFLFFLVLEERLIDASVFKVNRCPGVACAKLFLLKSM